MQEHAVTYMPSRRSLLGGGEPGLVECSCGWSHQAVTVRVAHKLGRLHLSGNL